MGIPEFTIFDWAVFSLSIFLVVIWTIRSGLKTTLSQFLVHNRNVPTFYLTITSIASFMGAGLMIGVVDMSYSSGIAVGILGITFAIGFYIVSLVAPKIRQITGDKNINTLPEFLSWRFKHPKKRIQTAAGLINLIAYLFLAALQFVGISIFLSHLSGIHPTFIIIFVGLIVTIYTSWAGLKGEFFTDYIQAFFMFIFLIVIIPLLAGKIGGGLEFISMIKNIQIGEPITVIGLMILGIFVWAPSLLGSMDVWQRIMAAKNSKVACQTMRWVSLFIFIVFFLFMLVGTASQSLLPNIENNPAVNLFLNLFPSGGLLGLALAGLMAAMMSTADTMILVAGISLATDLKKLQKSTRKNNSLFYNRIATAVCGIIAILFAILFKDIVNLVGNAFSSLAILVPAIVCGLFWKKTTEKGAFWSIIIGATTLYSLSILLTFVAPETAQLASLPALIVSIIMIFLISILTKNEGIN